VRLLLFFRQCIPPQGARQSEQESVKEVNGKSVKEVKEVKEVGLMVVRRTFVAVSGRAG
jgi:hypothetical protein